MRSSAASADVGSEPRDRSCESAAHTRSTITSSITPMPSFQSGIKSILLTRYESAPPASLRAFSSAFPDSSNALNASMSWRIVSAQLLKTSICATAGLLRSAANVPPTTEAIQLEVAVVRRGLLADAHVVADAGLAGRIVRARIGRATRLRTDREVRLHVEVAVARGAV